MTIDFTGHSCDECGDKENSRTACFTFGLGYTFHLCMSCLTSSAIELANARPNEP